MADEDPFSWSSDQVRIQLCSPESALRSRLHVKPILNLQTLEKTLQDNDIDGESLLALDDANVKEDLGIASFGQRRELRKIVQHLRDSSFLYQAETKKNHKRRLTSQDDEAETTPDSKRRRVQPGNLSTMPSTRDEDSPKNHNPPPHPSFESVSHSTKPQKRRIQPQNLSTVPLTRPTNLPDYAQFANPITSSSNIIINPEDFDPADLSDEWQVFLERYRENSEDSVLRPYNETDSEKELDSDDDASLVAELQSEHPPTTPRFSAEDVDGAIDETLEEYKRSWNIHKQAKKHKVAYRRWTQAAKAGTRRPQQNALQQELDVLRDRLGKFRRSIADKSMDYHKIDEVKRNCLNLQATVEDIAEKEYYLRVLTSDHPPVKPQQNPQPPAAEEKLSDGEELLESSDDADAEGDGQSDSVSEMSLGSDDVRSLSLSYDPSDTEWNPVLPSPKPTSLMHIPLHMTGAVDRVDPTSEHVKVTDLSHPTQPDDMFDVSSPTINPTSSPPIPKTPNKSQKIEAPLLAPSNQKFASTNGEEEEDSDLDRLPKNRYLNEGNTWDTAITLGSSPSKHSDDQTLLTDTGVKTPPLNPTPLESARRERRSNGNFPPIQELRAKRWVDVRGDAYLALCKIVYRTDRGLARSVLDFIDPLTTPMVQDRLRAGLINVQDTDISQVPQEDNDLDTLTLLTFFFLTYAHKKGFKEVWRVSDTLLEDALDMISHKAIPFDKVLRPLLKFYTETETSTTNLASLPKVTNSKSLANSHIDSARATSSHKNKQIVAPTRLSTPPQKIYTDTETDLDEEPSSLKKRKRHVEQSQKALSQQRDDQHRVQEQERRRQIMMDKFQSQEVVGEDRNVIVNSEEKVPILLDQHIARRIKPHQESGVQFIWRELVEDKKHQGCLLAHTMGLGKTMQVISFLVTLAQCNGSDRSEVRDLIPKKLRSGRVLILCPASLVDNWFDELMMWTPPHYSTDLGRGLLGPVYKISGSRNIKIRTIKDWQKWTPSVLIIGYESLRSLLTGKSVSQDDKKYLENALLQDPCIVVGDEAHKMKNAKSSISKLAQTFRTNSRIALTGSPLNNHLEEYHTMIDWIAPGYLGNLAQFKYKYSEPIERGLFAESTRYEKRKSLERLYVLKRDLAPKIDRRDISAIAGDMPQKTEFFITISLTELQKDMYGLLIRHILSGLSTDSASRKSSNAQLWSWLSILSWLCNHPTILTEKLESQDKSTAQAGVDNEDFDEDGAPANVDMDKYPIATLLPTFLEQYAQYEEANDKYNPTLSTRALVTQLLIQESVNRGERILLFSHSIPTLNYLQGMLESLRIKHMRIDGSTRTDQRQAATKEFNDDNNDYMVFLISTRAGGLGLNLQGANRVIIYDFGFNPSWEEQAIGRAYRLGQTKPVFVYRFRAGGSFEDAMYNKSIFKTQLFSRVVDQKNVIRHTSRDIKDYLFEPKEVEQKDLSECLGKDELLDKVVEFTSGAIRDLILTETFQREDEDDELTAEEKRLADAEVEMERLQRTNPAAYTAKQAEKQRAEKAAVMQQISTQSPYPFSTQLHGTDVRSMFKNAASGIVSEMAVRDAARANKEKVEVSLQQRETMDANERISEDSDEQSKAQECPPQ